jgi:hypothetical protein
MAMPTPEEMAQTMRNNVPEKTGKSMAAWHKLLAKAKLEKHGQMVKFLKTEHAVTHGFANLIAHDFLLESAPRSGEDDLVAAQYSGAKAELLPIYEKLIAAVSKFGKDVEVSPKKTSVSLRRKKQFAVIKPATRTRVDIGIQLKGEGATDRLLACKAGGMTSHEVRVENVQSVDKELVGWLREAYRRAE